MLFSVGMSNTTMEFSAFKAMADADRDKNPKLVIVDGAQGGATAALIVSPQGAQYWAVDDQRMQAVGVTNAQVQAAWMKEADADPTQTFPVHAQQLQSEMLTIVQTLRTRYPNLRLLYFSSRIYGGYASSPLNPEPYAYEGGYSVKWLIEQQINGDSTLSYGSGRAPWMSWGPYLWADGLNPREDGLTWGCAEFDPSDGTHPAAAAQQKVAAMLVDFFKSDETARSWFLRAQTGSATNITAVLNGASYQTTLAAGSLASVFGSNLATSTVQASGMPLPNYLGDAVVEVDGVPAPIYYASPSQINFVMPSIVSNGSVLVIANGVASKPVTAMMARYAPALFALDGSGKGPAAAMHGNYHVISAQEPARAGETIALFANGFGVRNPLLMIPDILPMVQAAGTSAQGTYFGAAPGWPGLNQISITIPPGTPPGPAVPLVLQMGTNSNTVTLAVQ